MRRRRTAACGAAAAGVVLCAGASGQERAVEDAAAAVLAKGEAPAREGGDDWTLRVEPGIWLVSPSGQMRLPGASSEKVRVEDLNLDSPRARPAGEIHVAADRWRFSFFGSQYARDTRFVSDDGFTLGDVSIGAGETVEVEFEFTVVEALAGYQVYAHDFGARSADLSRAIETVLRVYVIGGVRAYDIDIAVTEPGVSSSSVSEFFAEPVAGARAELEVADEFSLDLQLSAGGMFDSDRSSASLDIVTGLRWRPHPNVGVQVGWRQVAYWLNDGEDASEFDYTGRMAGIQAGVVIRF